MKAGLLLLLAAISPPAAIRVVGADFFAELALPDGTVRRMPATRIVAIPDVSCYRWVLRVAPETRVAPIRERLILPAPARQWGLVEDSPTVVARDRRSSDTDLLVGLSAGKITNEWCVA